MPADRSNLYYLGVGCLIAGILLAAGLAAFAVFTYRWSRGVEEAMKDPDTRRQRVLDILGGDALPDGYHAMVGLRVPFFLETAILTDEPPPENDAPPHLGRRGLIYVAFRDFGRDRQDLEAFFAGETDDPQALRRHNINVDIDGRLAKGLLDRPSGSIPWTAHRGDLSSARASGRHHGLVTLFLVHCPDDAYNRVGILFAPDPTMTEPATRDEPSEAPSPAATAESLHGTIADPQSVADFLGRFRFCPV